MSHHFGLTPEILLVLAILALTTVLFISNAIRIDVAAVLILVVMGVFRLLQPEELFSGFSSEAVISLIAIMIISAGLENTGINVRLSRWMIRVAGESPRKLLWLLMGSSGIFASFMRSVGTVALFMPIVNRINLRTGISKSYLLMPMAFAALLGGTLTMVGSGAQIVLNSLLRNTTLYASNSKLPHIEPFKLFEVFPIGCVLFISGTIYLFFICKRLFNEIKKPSGHSGSTKSHFKKFYGKDGDIFEIRVPASSPIVGGTVKDLEVKLDASLSLICMLQDKEIHFPPLRGTLIKPHSVLALMGTKESVNIFAEEYGLKVASKLNMFAEILHPARSGLSEAVVPPSSQFVGKEARELHMRRNHKLHVLALCRGGTIIQGDELNKTILRAGDTLGMYSTWEALYDFQNNPDFFVLTTTFPREKTNPEKIPHAIFFLLLAISLVVFAGYSISVGLLVGAVGMVATGVLTLDQAYEKVSWKTVFALAGLIPLGLLMQKSGTAEWLSDHMIPDEIKLPPWVVQTYLSLAASIFALIISPVGSTVVLVPVAMDVALSLGVDPRVYALTVALSTSNTFLLQSNQINSLISGPGNYTTREYMIVGGGLTILFVVILILGLHILF